jgi:hypothetical protein
VLDIDRVVLQKRREKKNRGDCSSRYDKRKQVITYLLPEWGFSLLPPCRSLYFLLVSYLEFLARSYRPIFARTCLAGLSVNCPSILCFSLVLPLVLEFPTYIPMITITL